LNIFKALTAPEKHLLSCGIKVALCLTKSPFEEERKTTCLEQHEGEEIIIECLFWGYIPHSKIQVRISGHLFLCFLSLMLTKTAFT